MSWTLLFLDIWFKILGYKRHWSWVLTNREVCCYFLSSLSHKPLKLISPSPHIRQPGKGAYMFDIHLNLELLLLRKNSQRRHICFGIMENWDQRDLSGLSLCHCLVLFSLSCTAQPSLRFVHGQLFTKLFHSLMLLIKLLSICRSLTRISSRSDLP